MLMNINQLMYKLENPQVYTGREINAVHKPVENIRAGHFINVCLVFPDKYEIGMSHQGLIILYHLLNQMEHVNAERCFLPGKQSIETFKEHNVPLFSLESKTPLKNFHLVGFSLLSEMNYTNVLQVLDLAQIPLLSRDRENDNPFPLIAAGGISAVNPEPLRDFIDLFGIGDGEEIFPDIIRILEEGIQNRLTREELLDHMDNIPGIYVPSLHPPVKSGRFYVPDLEPGTVKKRVTKNLGDTTNENSWIVPLANVVFNRLTVEIARGCPQNCRFCQAKSYYAPYRPRSIEKSSSHITAGLKATGFESFSLSSLSAGDYPDLPELLESIPGIIPPGVSFSLPSLRPSTLSDHLLATVALFKRTGITIVPEAGTQRLRNVINKDVTDEEIFAAVEMALRNRWQKIKLYFMLGLPTETMEDIDGIVRIITGMHAMARAAKQKIKIHASFSSFVPKPQTPLQWAKRQSLDDLFKKTKYLKDQLKTISHRYLKLDFHDPRGGIVETIMTRGDYRTGELLLEAFEKGEVFSAWDHDFNFPVWEKLIEGTVYREFLSEFSLDEALPWDFLQVNFKKEYLKEEYCNALKAVPTPSCDSMECKTCGGCLYKMKRKNMSDRQEQQKEPTAAAKPLNNVSFNKIRIFYEKTGDFIFFSHLSIVKYIERLIRRTGIVFKCTEGFTPRIKITTLPALPVFAAGKNEVAEVYLDASYPENRIMVLLNQSAAPAGFTFKGVRICNPTPALPRDIHFLGFEFHNRDVRHLIDEITSLLGESDAINYSENHLALTIDYANQGQERFAKIYKHIDPEKKYTMNLTRTMVRFKSEGKLSNE
jgi:radical SAM family uncharacterized protein